MSRVEPGYVTFTILVSTTASLAALQQTLMVAGDEVHPVTDVQIMSVAIKTLLSATLALWACRRAQATAAKVTGTTLDAACLQLLRPREVALQARWVAP